MVEPLVIQVTRQFKAALLAYEEGQVRRMVRAWMGVDRRLAGAVQALADEVAELRAQGVSVTAETLYRQARYQALLAQIAEEVRRFEREAGQIIVDGETDLVQRGRLDAQRAIQASYWQHGMRASFNRLPARAVEYIVGVTADGAPLFSLLQKRAIAPDAVEGLTNQLLDAVTRGYNPRKTARLMQDGLTQGLQKALVIARDQQLRAYRTASDDQYRESGVVSAKRRVCAKDTRTCLACLAMDGELIPVGAPMYDHAQGRCTAIPVVDGLPALDWQKGPEWFATLSEAQQQKMMGKERWDAWKAGAFRFEDQATPTYHKVWGQGLAVTPLSRLGASQ